MNSVAFLSFTLAMIAYEFLIIIEERLLIRTCRSNNEIMKYITQNVLGNKPTSFILLHNRKLKLKYKFEYVYLKGK